MTEEKREVLNHLCHIEGQIHGIQKVINKEKECIGVITQLSAVRSSIDHIMGMIVAENLKHCFENPEEDLEEQEERLAQAISMVVRK